MSGVIKYSNAAPAQEQDMTAFQNGMSNNSGWLNNFTFTNPLKNISSLSNSMIGKAVSGVGSGIANLGQQLVGYTPSQNYTAGMFNKQTQGMDATQLTNYMEQNKLSGYTYTPDGNGGWLLGSKDGNNVLNDSAIVGQTGGGWNLGQMLGNTQNLLNIGTAGWGLYENINSYKTKKDVMNKQKELLDQQIQYNKENMAYIKKERERQDTMRSNVAAQRNSTSNVRSF